MKKNTDQDKKDSKARDAQSNKKPVKQAEQTFNPWELAKKQKGRSAEDQPSERKKRRSPAKPLPQSYSKPPYKKKNEADSNSKQRIGKSKPSKVRKSDGKTVWPTSRKPADGQGQNGEAGKPFGKKPYTSKTAGQKSGSKKSHRTKPGSTKAKTLKPASPGNTGLAPGSQPSPRAGDGIRLNRYISLAGICARRKADELIAGGRVKLNGEVVTEMGIRVSASDVVEVGGNRITPLDHEYILLNKPSNFITTSSDEKDRQIVMDLIEDEKLQKSGLFPVGRLDRNTVGILLLTNDGELAHRLMHPSFQIDKLYHVTTESPVQPHQLAQLRKGVDSDGETLNLDDVQYINLPKKNELGILLHEGKNRHIRRMLAAVGHESISLKRIRYAGLSTEGVRLGKWRRLTKIEIKRLRRLVKLK